MDDKELAEVKKGIALGNILIPLLEKDPDPVAAQAAEILREQRQELIDKLEAHEKGEPPPIVIKMKPAVVKGVVPNG